MSNWFQGLLSPALIWVLIPITWLIVTGIVEMVKSYQRHTERIAMIEQGIHPDAHQETEMLDDATDPAETVYYKN